MAKKSISDVLINFKGDHKDLDKAIGGSKSSLTQFASSARTAAGALIKIGVVGAAAMAGLTFAAWKTTKGYVDVGIEIDKVMKITGLGAQTIAGMTYAAEQEHVSIEGLTTGWSKLTKMVYDADKGVVGATDAFDELGISIYDNEGNLKNVAQLTYEIADAMKEMDNDTKKSALAQKLFGRDGLEMLPFLEMGKKGIKELEDEYEKLGHIWTDEMVADAKIFGDKLTVLEYKFKAIKLVVGQELMPEFEKIVDWLMENGEWMKTTFTEIFDIEVSEFGTKAVEQLDKVKAWIDANKGDIKWWVDFLQGKEEYKAPFAGFGEVGRLHYEPETGKTDVFGTAFPRWEQSINIVLDHYAVDKFLRGEVVNVTGTNAMAGT